MSSNLPLPQFYAQTLSSLLPIFDDTLPPTSPQAKEILSTSLDNLHLIHRMINTLGVFSDNETIDELGDGELGFMTVLWVLGECEGKGGLSGHGERIQALKRSETAFNGFLSLLSSYTVLNNEEQAESSAAALDNAPIAKDPAKRREAKIRQYKREKELRQQISALSPGQPESSSSPISFILGLLPSPPNRPGVISTNPASTSVNPDQPPLRDLTILILRLLHTLTLSSLSSTTMELEILSTAPIDPSHIPSSSQPPSQTPQDNTWRLDRNPTTARPRELISGGGKVLRPFTILPSISGLSDRERLRSEVFRSGHRLPTMTIDEYLEEEQRRGGIISGGGQASYDAPTDSELLALAAEDDGTVLGEEKFEEKRRKEEDWSVYTEENRRGAGNTMNRG